MDDVFTACSLMKVINVLCDNMHIKQLLKRFQTRMARVRHSLLQLTPTIIVKLLHQVRITVPSFNGCHILNLVLLPKTSAVTECFNAALCAHSGSR